MTVSTVSRNTFAALRRWCTLRSDPLLTAAWLVVDLAVFSPSDLRNPDYTTAGTILVLVLWLLGGVPLLYRRRAPIVVFGVVWLHALVVHAIVTSVASAFDYLPTITVLLALYTLASRRHPALGVLALCLSCVPLVWEAHLAYREIGPERTASDLTNAVSLYVVIGVGFWVVGQWRYSMHARMRALETRRESEAREAAMGERLRIARELHDIVAHSVTVIVLQAAAAGRMVSHEPDRAAAALRDIEDLGVQTMDELRRMLSVVGPADRQEELSSPGLDQLDALLARVRSTGVHAFLTVDGTPSPADPSVDLTAYRIVQEALTNVTKHCGPGAHATVSIRWADHLDIDVTDDGGGTPPSYERGISTGNGLTGLRERVKYIGGRLDAGPLPTGFRVSARLPLRTRTPLSTETANELVEMAASSR
ncbi:sensor histidine kinase [Cryptosporangium sp. NPDC051539]|uniref:sensor histidine kinase n=1 Tax=Cryptosporangium sp. NPDC051539 TaxID=3363962 RepID=UPI0037A8B348